MGQRGRPEGTVKAERGLTARRNRQGKIVWYARIKINKKLHWFGGFPTKDEARDFYQNRKTEQRHGQFFPDQYRHRGTLRLDVLLKSHMTARPPKGLRNDRGFCAFWTDKLGDQPVAAITAAQIEVVKHELQGSGRSAQTVLHYLKFLRCALNVAKRDGILAKNSVHAITLPKVTTARLRFLSLEEEGQILDAIGRPYDLWVRFAILSGLRQGEQFRLRWRDVDLENRLLTLEQTKAGHVQTAKLGTEEVEILWHLGTIEQSDYVFTTDPKGGPANPNKFYKRHYLKIVRKLGLADVTWHTLRHTYASRLAMNRGSSYDIATGLRHSSLALVKRYAHLSPSYQADLAEKVSGFGRPKTWSIVDRT